MLPFRPIVVFFVKLLLIYGLLAWPWSFVRRGYAVAYGAVASAVFGSFGPGGEVRFEPLPIGAPVDTELVLRKRGSSAVGKSPHNARFMGYLATAEVIALILATPIGWRRRFMALLWGMLLVHAFIYLRLEIMLLHWYSGEPALAIYQPSTFWGKALAKAFELTSVSLTPTFMAPIFIWILATFRRADLDRWRADRPAASSAR